MMIQVDVDKRGTVLSLFESEAFAKQTNKVFIGIFYLASFLLHDITGLTPSSLAQPTSCHSD